MNILGYVLRELAPVAIDLGSQVIKTKFEENVLGEYKKQVLNGVVDGISAGLSNAVKSTFVDNTGVVVPTTTVRQPMTATTPTKNYQVDTLVPLISGSGYQFDIRNYQ